MRLLKLTQHGMASTQTDANSIQDALYHLSPPVRAYMQGEEESCYVLFDGPTIQEISGAVHLATGEQLRGAIVSYAGMPAELLLSYEIGRFVTLQRAE